MCGVKSTDLQRINGSLFKQITKEKENFSYLNKNATYEKSHAGCVRDFSLS